MCFWHLQLAGVSLPFQPFPHCPLGATSSGPPAFLWYPGGNFPDLTIYSFWICKTTWMMLRSATIAGISHAPGDHGHSSLSAPMIAHGEMNPRESVLWVAQGSSQMKGLYFCSMESVMSRVLLIPEMPLRPPLLVPVQSTWFLLYGISLFSFRISFGPKFTHGSFWAKFKFFRFFCCAVCPQFSL